MPSTESTSPRRDLFLATTNPSKARRLRWVVQGLGLRSRGLPENAGAGPDENGESFRENAEIKACSWSERLGDLTAASDGGLVIPALGPNWNPLRTARAAGPGADDASRASHLLALAKDLSGEQRTVFWLEALALARKGRVLASWEAAGTRALLVEQFDPQDLVPGFWAASLCYVPSLGRPLSAVSEQDLAWADPAWSRLRELVHAFFGSGQADPDIPA